MLMAATACVCGILVSAAVWISTQGNDRRLKALIRPAPSSPDAAAAAGRAASSDAAGAENSAAHTAPPLHARLRRRFTALFGRIQPTMNTVEALSFDLELVAICLQSGLPTDRAVRLAAHASGDRSGLARLARSLELGEVDNLDAHLAPVVSLIEFSRSTGVALAPLLSGLAVDLRRSEHRRRQLAAARLGVHLVIPLGACILPSFVLLGVVPVLLTLIGDMSVLFQQ